MFVLINSCPLQKNFSRQSLIKVANKSRTYMAFSHKVQQNFTWPDMSFYAR